MTSTDAGWALPSTEQPAPEIAVPFRMLERSGHHWRASQVAEALNVEPAAVSLLIARHLTELTAHGPLPVAGHRVSDAGQFWTAETALNTRQLLTLLLLGDSAVSRALRSAALDGFRDLTPEALAAHVAAAGGPAVVNALQPFTPSQD